LKRLSILTFQFYRLLLVFNVAFSLLSIFIIVLYFGLISTTGFFFAKIAGIIAAIAIHYYSASESYFYFRNAGCRIRQIILYTVALDISIFTVTAILFNLASNVLTYVKR
jgi:hypothetical protein